MMKKKHVLAFEGYLRDAELGKSAVFIGKDTDQTWFESNEIITIIMPEIFQHVKKKFGEIYIPYKVKLTLFFKTK